MSTILKRFVKGIVLRGESSDVSENAEGSLFQNSTELRLKTYIEGAVRQIVTNSQEQTLTNKTIDAASNTISNLTVPMLASGVLDTDLTSVSSSDDTLPSAKAVKTYVDAVAAAQNEASEIAVSPVVGNAPNNNTVQKVLETHESRLDTAEINITNLDTNKVTGPGSSTNNAIARFNQTTGKFIKDSVAILGDGGTLTGLTDIQVDDPAADGIKLSVTNRGVLDRTTDRGVEFLRPFSNSLDLNLKARDILLSGSATLPVSVNSTTTGSNAGINSGDFSNVVLTNSGLISIQGIVAKTNGSLLILTNNTGNDVEILNNVSNILTGTESDITFRNRTSLIFTYSGQIGRWVIIGGTGGATSSVKLIAGEALSANDLVYQSKVDGKVYKASNDDDDKVDVLGFARKAALINASVEIVTGGVLKGFTGLSVGTLYYLGLNGAITTTAPSTNGSWVVSVGMAVSATELVINPVAAASAVYLTDSENSISLANNQSSASDVTSLLFDPLQVRSFIIEYSIYREDSLQAAAQVGQLRGAYNSKNSTWLISDDYAGENAGVEFSIQPSGQIQYTSTEYLGTSHSCTMKYTIKRTFSI